VHWLILPNRRVLRGAFMRRAKRAREPVAFMRPAMLGRSERHSRCCAVAVRSLMCPGSS